MSKRIFSFLLVICLCFSCFEVAVAAEDDVIPVRSISIGYISDTNLEPGETATLRYTIYPSNATNKNVTWSSSDPEIATVSEEGVVTGVGAGSVTITVTTEDGGFEDSQEFLCGAKLTGVKLSKTSLKLEAGGITYQLKATPIPENAAVDHYSWYSSDDMSYYDYVEVDNEGNLTTNAIAGTSTIKVTAYGTSYSDKYTAECEVEVWTPTVKLNKKSIKLEAKKKYTLKPSFKQKNVKNTKITWTSSDTSIAKVSKDGVVTGVKPGTATITAETEYGNNTAECKVKVWSYPSKVTVKKTSIMAKGSKMQLTPKLKPEGAKNKKFTWSSSNKKVLTVSKKGVITAKKAGTATITVKTSNGKKAKCKITVKDYKYLADTAFRSIHSKYSQSTPRGVNLYAYTNIDGDKCIAVTVFWKITSNYETKFLFINGTKIEDPEAYYQEKIDRAYVKTHYYDLLTEYLDAASKALGSWGVFIPAKKISY